MAMSRDTKLPWSSKRWTFSTNFRRQDAFPPNTVRTSELFPIPIASEATEDTSLYISFNVVLGPLAVLLPEPQTATIASQFVQVLCLGPWNTKEAFDNLLLGRSTPQLFELKACKSGAPLEHHLIILCRCLCHSIMFYLAVFLEVFSCKRSPHYEKLFVDVLEASLADTVAHWWSEETRLSTVALKSRLAGLLQLRYELG